MFSELKTLLCPLLFPQQFWSPQLDAVFPEREKRNFKVSVSISLARHFAECKKSILPNADWNSTVKCFLDCLSKHHSTWRSLSKKTYQTDQYLELQWTSQNHKLRSLSVWFECSLIDIDSGFEEDLLSKNQNCIILETVHLENAPQAYVIAVKDRHFPPYFINH